MTDESGTVSDSPLTESIFPESGPAAGRKALKKRLRFGLVFGILAVLAGGGYWGWTVYRSMDESGKADTPAVQYERADEGFSTAIRDNLLVLPPLKEIALHAVDSEKAPFLNFSLVLEFYPASARNELIERAAGINEVILCALKNGKADMLQTLQGKIVLKNNMITDINRMLSSGRVDNVYITDFLIGYRENE